MQMIELNAVSITKHIAYNIKIANNNIINDQSTELIE